MVNRTTNRSSKSDAPRKNNPQPKSGRFRFWPAILVAVVLFIGYQISLLFHSYARDVAIPVEQALVQVGAVKKCSREDAGRGPDSRIPWYYAIYEVPGNMEQATEKIHAAFERAGLRLSDGPNPPNTQDNRFFSDLTSKRSPFGDLRDGNVQYLVSVYPRLAFNTEEGSLSCATASLDSPLEGRMTLILTINLPEFKR